MSVYLSRSPYYLNSYRAGGARTTLFARKPRRARNHANRQLWATGHTFAARRPRRGAVTLFSALSSQTGESLVFGARKTGETFKKSAETFSQMAHAVKNVRSKKVRFEIGPGAVMGSLITIAILLGGVYLAHFNQVATKGYELRRLEADRQQLLTQYEIKNMKLAEVQSLNTIVQSDKANAMRRPYSIDYVKGGSVLAAR